MYNVQTNRNVVMSFHHLQLNCIHIWDWGERELSVCAFVLCYIEKYEN